MNIPAVSVIIPMYNAEKYISDCLDSILNQTFQDFEVIVVDDCSKDKSAEIVRDYAEKFGGRLKIITLMKNSGNTGYSARNKGFKFSRGEYVYFMDADDMIDENALEIFYTLAKDFNSDVIYSGSYYIFSSNNSIILRRDDEYQRLFEKGVAIKPNLTLNNPHKNLKMLFDSGTYFWASWTKFVNRDFLIRNQITFPEIVSGGDFIWAVEIFCYAERYLRIPDALYFYRDVPESRTRKQRVADKQITAWISAFISWSETLKKLSDKVEILQKNPKYCWSALNLWLYACFSCCEGARFQLSSNTIYEILKDNFADKNSDFALTLPFILSIIDAQQKNYITAKQRIIELEKEISLLKGKE